ncbi:MAG: histidine phosphatase family protein [Planctomycetota bacterium]
MTPVGRTPREPRRVWLVRHGETEGQSSIRFHGQNDVLLSDLGREQIRALIPLFAGLRPVAVYHSPLQRAVESASVLAKAHGWDRTSMRVDDRLREISFGDCEGLTREEIEAAHPEFWALHQKGEADSFPGGESRHEFAARVAAFVRELSEQHDFGDLVIVAHRGTVRHALRTLLAVPDAAPDPRPELRVRLGSLSVLRAEERDALRRSGKHWQVELLDFVP